MYINRINTASSFPRKIVTNNIDKPWLRPIAQNQPKINACEHNIGIGQGIVGQGSYPVGPKTTPELYHWATIINKISSEEGLDPFNVKFWVMNRDSLLHTAARSGFPVRYKHWSFGQAYQELLLPQKYGLSKLYELVINTDPCYAYLLAENPLYSQKVVMAHVMGHSDFFKNNYMFGETNRNMLNRMSDIATSINSISNTENVSEKEVEDFIEKVHSIQWLIDLSTSNPRKLKVYSDKKDDLSKVSNDWGKVDVSHLPSHMDRRINDHESLTKEKELEEKRRDEAAKKNPQHPERDVIAFLIENSTTLKPWQKKILTLMREESYYFVPQLQTKIMNEGWATYWHTKIMKHKDVVDLENVAHIGMMLGNVLALQKFNINPYTLGYVIFKDIEERWDKGKHGPDWEAITNMDEKENYDKKEMKGKEKILEVRKKYNDVQFLRTFFTQEIANKLQMYTWDTEPGENIEISSKDFQDIKDRLLEMLSNGGQPLIQVIDGNYANRGELVLEHVHSYDLKQDYAEMTLANIKAIWGRPVHLITSNTSKDGSKKIMKISVLDSENRIEPKDVIKRYILKPNGENDYECDASGKPVHRPASGGWYF